jgi:cyclase
MVSRRIIPCLDIKDGRTVKGVNFVSLRDAGDPVALAARYTEEGADELVFLDITATVEKRKTLRSLVKAVSKEIAIPFTVGGGVSSVEDARALLYSGADKVAINSAAVRNPELISELSREFGAQAVVVAVDAKCIDGVYFVHLDGGRTKTEREVFSWCIEAQERGAGEILLTSMDHDGTKNGFSVSLYEEVSKIISLPVIASGGAGNIDHFINLFSETRISAALAASIFHFSEVSIPELKMKCHDKGIPMRIV